MSSYSEISCSLTEALHLTQVAVAVPLTEAIPPGVESWGGHSPAGCRFWQEAGKRVFATSANDLHLCAIGLYTHNLEMTPAAASGSGTALKVFGDLTYVRPEDVPMIPVLNSKPRQVVYGSLAEIPVAPDVVLLLCVRTRPSFFPKDRSNWRAEFRRQWNAQRVQ